MNREQNSQKVDSCASFPKHMGASAILLLHSNQAEDAYLFLCKSETSGIRS